MGLCMCGADDCPACNPGCRKIVRCRGCGEDFYAIDVTWDGYCEECDSQRNEEEKEEDEEDQE